MNRDLFIYYSILFLSLSQHITFMSRYRYRYKFQNTLENNVKSFDQPLLKITQKYTQKIFLIDYVQVKTLNETSKK